MNYVTRPNPRRHGSVYIAVLGVSLIVATLAVGGILAARVQLRDSEGSGDSSTARLCAQSGLQLARLWISQDPSWRTNHPNGNWSSGLAIGGGTVSISVTDTIDSDLTNRAYDPAQITVTANSGQAQQILRQTLSSSPVPLPILGYALHTGGQLHVYPGMRVMAGNGTLSTSGSLYNQSTIEGNVDVASSAANGTIFGSLTTGTTGKAMPSSGMDETYARLGTLLGTQSTINKQVFGPGVNPWGTANADGVYVIRSAGNVQISDSRIYGTMVIIAPGKTVTITGKVFMQASRADYPVLIVNGNLQLQYTTSGGLSESLLNTNFNPAGAPYQGNTDADTTDTYPSEIQGLVHVIGGTVSVMQPCTVRGAIICESTAATDAVSINAATFQLVYDKSLYTNPPQFYTTSVPMVPLAGSLTQLVN